MNSQRIFVLAISTVMFCRLGCAQIQQDFRNELRQIHDFGRTLPAAQRARLSSGAANVLRLADLFTSTTGIHDLTFTPASQDALARAMVRARSEGSEVTSSGPVRLNAHAFDFALSRLAGFTQSETSSAWCGNNIVAGYNDSGGVLRSMSLGHGGVSFDGVSVSHDGGRSFLELPFLNPGDDPANFLGGDPVLACSSPSVFYYASLFEKSGPPTKPGNRKALTGISVNVSLDGGLRWQPPVAAVVKDISHFLDKEWLAVDPTNPRRLYLTYTDFDLSFTRCGTPRTGIELVRSENGGASWSRPVVVDEFCGLGFSALQGSQVAVGPNGEVHVSWVNEGPVQTAVRSASSLDHGRTFSAPLDVAEVSVTGLPGFSALQGLFRTNDFPALAVDTSKGPRRGTVYLAFTDGSSFQINDSFTFTGTYNFSDVMLASSTDVGGSWSVRGAVHPAGDGSPGRDQFMPGVAVDSTGRLAVCYSDRREDKQNNLVDHFCSLSEDGGATFSEMRQTPNSWVPSHLNDVFINPAYMGDYDAVSADRTGGHAGFFSTFQVEINSNPDVFGMRE